jgi:cytochrome c2
MKVEASLPFINGRLAARFFQALFVGVMVAACSLAAEGSAPAMPTWTAQEELGSRLFSAYCVSCHSTTAGAVIVGPSLAGIANTANERVEGMTARTYFERSLIAPDEFLVEGYPDLMPRSFDEVLSEEERQAIIAYLLSLR